MTDKTILKFGAVDNAEAGDLAGWVVVEGKPTMKTTVQHTTADGKVMSGTWQASPGPTSTGAPPSGVMMMRPAIMCTNS